MKLKLIALFLTLTVMSWAQSTPSTQAPAAEQKSAPADATAGCSCCDKMTSSHHADMHKDMHHDASAKDGKEAMACCAGKNAKGEMACCGGKDAKACAKEDQSTAKGSKSPIKGDQSSTACCGNGKCGEGHEMACCSDKDGKNMLHGCCGGNQCGSHEHNQHTAPGN